MKKIVCLGGGTGTSVLLSGLKEYPVDLSAIITVFDDGGSSGKLRKELGVLPPGDARQCIIALATKDDNLDLFRYRFETGTLKGHNIGNILISSAESLVGNLEKAIERVGRMVDMKGRVLPVTLDRATLKAQLFNGEAISGEDAIVNCSYLSKIGIKGLFLEPKAEANLNAIAAIEKANLITIGPGKFFTSIIPIFLVDGIVDAIKKSPAKKVFVCNLMTQVGNTDGFSVEDFVTILERYLGKGVIDYVIFNTGKLSKKLLKEVRKVFPKADFIKYDKNLLNEENFIGVDVLNRQIRKLNPADILVKGANQRTMILHDSEKLARIILNLK